MKKWKTILLGFVAALAAIQFIRPDKNLSGAPPGKDDLATRHAAPPAVRRVLETACYDCHSNHTRYPWYAEVQPLGWWLAKHINDGKRDLNFSEFAAYDPRTQMKRLDALVDEIETRGMPLKSYTWIHRDARLSDAQIRVLVEWAEALHDKIEAKK